MKLSELIRGIELVRSPGALDIEVGGIATDSRRVGKGDLFVAVHGDSFDGHDFAAQAVAGGACAVVVDRPVGEDVPELVVRDTARTTALLAKRFYGDPASDLVLVGITGTNGKTSTSFLLRAILQRVLGPTGIIGTVGFGSALELAKPTHTTPDSVSLQRIMADFRSAGCRSVVMEVSSHAAAQERTSGLEFDLGVFTNITRDHLDYHGNFEKYVSAKELLAKNLIDEQRDKAPGTLVYNSDDSRIAAIAGRFSGEKISFGTSQDAEIRADNLGADLSGTDFELVIGSKHFPVSLKLLGSFSAHNALAAAAAAHTLGLEPAEIVAGLEAVDDVPGRFQVISTGTGPKVVIDYAHTPDALENLLTFCRELRPKRIITVFGCGGDRDRGKRPLMGKIAVEISDAVYITDDNPRTEDPERIIGDILEGIEKSGTRATILRDRAEAIRRAVREGREGDLVVIAGKGHENEQILADRRIPFSDETEARNALGTPEVDDQG